ncbi:MAG: lytic transglycosylase domain-containing protein [Pseudomonadota bacterium]
MHFTRKFSVLTRLISATFAVLLFTGVEAGAKSQSERAVSLALKGQYRSAMSTARDPLARKVVEWIYLQSKPTDAGYQRLMNFSRRNSHWPKSSRIESSAEGHLIGANVPVTVLQAHFRGRSPRSPEGKIALARLKLASGDRAGASKLVRSAWLDTNLSKTGEDIIARQYRSLLKKGDFHARWTRFIYKRKMSAATRNANRISRTHKAATRAAALLFKRKSAGLKAYKKLPKNIRNSLAMQFALARYYRWTRKPKSAANVLVRVNAKAANAGAGNVWWKIRKRTARDLLGPGNRKHWRQAYQLGAQHGFTKGKSFAEGEFLAGWIALRFLNEPKRAYAHFARIPGSTTSPTRLSRGWYWLGRSQLALGRPADARASYRKAAAYHTRFYGQLARDALGLGGKPLPLKTVSASPGDKAAVRQDELLRAFTLVARAGGRKYERGFLWAMSRRFKTPSQHAAVSGHIHTHSGYANAMRYAKIAKLRNVHVDNWAFPKGAMPRWKRLGKPVERALVFGLSRQESEFQATAGSHAGAQGLMQLMPGTAKIVAKKYRQRHRRSRLTREPAYNVMLGTALLGDLMDDYDGSIIMTLAAYNAGPGNVRKWVAKFGDPRSRGVDPLDWTESITFQETRQYVRKVMANMHVYRNRFGSRRLHGMMADLHGAGGKTGTVPLKAACGGSGGALSIASLIATC